MKDGMLDLPVETCMTEANGSPMVALLDLNYRPSNSGGVGVFCASV